MFNLNAPCIGFIDTGLLRFLPMPPLSSINQGEERDEDGGGDVLSLNINASLGKSVKFSLGTSSVCLRANGLHIPFDLSWVVACMVFISLGVDGADVLGLKMSSLVIMLAILGWMVLVFAFRALFMLDVFELFDWDG